ncbi:hypothetical protein [Methanobacterium formicicum]|nr:hypothetical protein [Methanobacterium formicicum]
MTYDYLSKIILFSLHRKGYYGAKHTPVVHVCKRIPQHSCKDIKKKIKELIKGGLLVPYPTRHGLDVHININRLSEVKTLIKPLEDEMDYFKE